eukprot:6197799-Pleurochrysis_carterae.AAC.1
MTVYTRAGRVRVDGRCVRACVRARVCARELAAYRTRRVLLRVREYVPSCVCARVRRCVRACARMFARAHPASKRVHVVTRARAHLRQHGAARLNVGVRDPHDRVKRRARDALRDRRNATKQGVQMHSDGRRNRGRPEQLIGTRAQKSSAGEQTPVLIMLVQ